MGQVYAVGSGKGGVGKTTTVANLAAALSAAGYDVVAVDADLAMANLGPMVGVDPDAGATVHDALAGDAAIEDAIRSGERGFDVVPGAQSLGGFAAADPAELRSVIDELREHYDIVVLDTSAGLTHEVAVPLGLADDAVLATTPDLVAVRDATKTSDFASRIDGSVAGLVLTRARNDEGTERIRSELGADLLTTVPEDAALAEETIAAAGSESAAAYNALAASLLGVEKLPEPAGSYALASPDPPTVPAGLTPAVVPATDDPSTFIEDAAATANAERGDDPDSGAAADAEPAKTKTDAEADANVDGIREADANPNSEGGTDGNADVGGDANPDAATATDATAEPDVDEPDVDEPATAAGSVRAADVMPADGDARSAERGGVLGRLRRLFD